MLIQSLQREVKDKEQLYQKSQSLISSLQEQSNQLADTNAVYKSQIQKMEEKLEESKQEIVKGNSIISKQQGDFKQLKAKLKLKSSQMQEHERTIQVKQEGIGEQMNVVNQLKEQQIQTHKELELQKVELNELKTVNSTLKAKLTDAQESLKSNGEYIAYLNKQLNEKPGGATAASLGGTGPLMSTTASSSFGAKLTKPPTGGPGTGAASGTTFKPTFSSIDQLNAGGGATQQQQTSTILQRSNSRQSFDR